MTVTTSMRAKSDFGDVPVEHRDYLQLPHVDGLRMERKRGMRHPKQVISFDLLLRPTYNLSPRSSH